MHACAQVTGEGFSNWCRMPYLATLSLQNANAVTDAGCAAIARIAPLRTLNLKNCPAMSDKGLAALAPLKRLSHLRLQGNQVGAQGFYPYPWALCTCVERGPGRAALST